MVYDMELLDIYNEQRERTGRTVVRNGEVFEGERLLVVHVCVLNSRNEMLIQQRQMSKDRYPGCWDISAGGFVLSGEDSADAVRRELREEVGLQAAPESLTFLFTEPFSYVLDDFYLVRSDAELSSLTLQPEEVSDAKWASQEEVEAMIADGRFVDYPVEGIRRVFRLAAGLQGGTPC